MSEIYLANAILSCKCSNTRCPNPYLADWNMEDAYAGVYYRWLFQIPGAGPYSFELVSNPDWVIVYFDQVTGRIRVEGLPPEEEIDEIVTVSFIVANCGRELDEVGIDVGFEIIEPEFQLLVDFDLSDISDFDGQIIETD